MKEDVNSLAELLALPPVRVYTKCEDSDFVPMDIDYFEDVPGVEVRYFGRYDEYSPEIKALYLDGEPVCVRWTQHKYNGQYWLLSFERECKLWARVREVMHARMHAEGRLPSFYEETSLDEPLRIRLT